MSITLDIPIIIDTSGDVQIFSEDLDISDANFIFASVSNTSIDASNLANSLFFIDDNTGSENKLFKIDVDNMKTFATQVREELFDKNHKFTLVGSTHTAYAPRNSTYSSGIAEHFIQYIASVLFGHPLAQAPINNEQSIKTQIESADISNQIYTDFFVDISENDGVSDSSGNESVNGIIQSLFEQIIVSAASRIYTGDASFNSFPIKVGDTIRFLLRIQGKISSDTSKYSGGGFVGSIQDLNTVYSHLIDPDTGNSMYSYRPLYTDADGNLCIKSKIWVISFELGGTPYPYYTLPTNTYTAIGTPLYYNVFGNKVYVDTSDTNYYPNDGNGVEFMMFRRDISENYALSETDASYISYVNTTYVDGGIETDFSGTYIFNVSDETLNAGNDISLVKMSLDACLNEVYNNPTDQTLYLTTGRRFTILSGTYDISNNTDLSADQIVIDGPNMDITSTNITGTNLIYNDLSSSTTEAYYKDTGNVYVAIAKNDGNINLNGSIMDTILGTPNNLATDISYISV